MIINLHFLFIFFFPLFSITSSSPPPLNFTVYGTADVNNTSIILTQSLHNCTPNPHHSNIGRVFYKNPIRFLDSTFNSTLSFSTRFSFTITHPPPPCLAGEGLAFLITTDSNSLPHSVGCIGLPKSIDQFSSDDSSFLAVEFDTNFDQDLGDINNNHVGIDVDSIFSVASVDLMSIGIDLKRGKRITAWIEYRNSEKTIQIWVGLTRVKPETPILVAPLDISKRFNGFMYVGFSGSNGKGSATHLIDHWQFRTSESDPPNLQVETIESENCLICFPQDYEEHEKGSTSTNHPHLNKKALELALEILGLIVILILVTVCFVVLYVCFFMKKRNPLEKPTQETEICSRFQENRFDRMPRRIKLSEIRSATKGFCRNQIVCQGVSAIVYEASLPWCGHVAVKRFVHVSKTGSFDGQFVTEFVKMVGSLRHRNLIHLQGWCCEKKELILVYEFVTNGSLDKILDSLSFDSRLKILLGVSSALLYLHEECEIQIIHRNVKTSNIMLDENFVPKLGDSGIGELYDHNSRARDGTLQAGAMGYLAPEYVFSGVPTVKTDVYSFGVVVLEVLSGRPPVDEGGVVVTDWAWDLWEKKTLVAGADPTLMGRFNGVDMEMVLMVGLICVHPNYEMRPIMKEVVQMLQGGLVPSLPAEKPTVMIQSVVVERLPLPEEEVVVGCGGDDGVTSWGTPKSHFSKV